MVENGRMLFVILKQIMKTKQMNFLMMYKKQKNLRMIKQILKMNYAMMKMQKRQTSIYVNLLPQLLHLPIQMKMRKKMIINLTQKKKMKSLQKNCVKVTAIMENGKTVNVPIFQVVSLQPQQVMEMNVKRVIFKRNILTFVK